MRILLLTAQVPYPPQAGGALRTYGLIDGLHRAGHATDILTFCEPGQPEPSMTPLAALCNQIHAVPVPIRTISGRLRDLVLSSNADMARRFYSEEYAAALKTMLTHTDYDLVQMESLEMSVYLPIIKAQKPAVRTIYDSFNAEFDLQRLIFDIDRRNPARLPGALYSLIQWRRLTSFERYVCQHVDHVIAVSDADAKAFHRLSANAAVDVVPNGIYASEYAQPSTTLELGSAALLFTGTMNYRPNVDAVLWFADQVLGEIRKAVPDVRLFIVGNKPHDRLNAIRQRADVEITGYVQDVLPFLRSATVYVAPLRMGSGTRLKLLQAMAAGCAIVSTNVGAQGLDVTPGREMILADDAISFAQATVTLLRDAALRQELANAALRRVCEQYDWSVIIPRLLRIYKEMGVG